MMDPDAPSRQNPKAAEWLHWLIINISGKITKLFGFFGSQRKEEETEESDTEP
jgi:phosphatidylethanolamine-binding protein (PEBP) family uncharacterized protein